MATSSSTSPVKSAIVLLLTLVIVAAVLIFLSTEKPGNIDSQNSILASRKVDVNMRAMYETVKGAGNSTTDALNSPDTVAPEGTSVPAKIDNQLSVKSKAPVSAPVKSRTVQKSVQKQPEAEVKKLPTPKEIKAAMPGGKKPWAINVASFSKKAPAIALVKKLTSAGYNTYNTDFVKSGVKWYRVRVGFFTTKDDAVKFGAALGKKLKIRSKPWPVRPHWDEISTHITKQGQQQRTDRISAPVPPFF